MALGMSLIEWFGFLHNGTSKATMHTNNQLLTW